MQLLSVYSVRKDMFSLTFLWTFIHNYFAPGDNAEGSLCVLEMLLMLFMSLELLCGPEPQLDRLCWMCVLSSSFKSLKNVKRGRSPCMVHAEVWCEMEYSYTAYKCSFSSVRKDAFHEVWHVLLFKSMLKALQIYV